MQGDRIKILLEWIDENPEDPFNWYSLALEYRKTDAPHALEILERLVLEHPAYVPSYYPLAQLWMDLDEWPRALAVTELGVIQAKSQKKDKISQELLSLGRQIQDEMLD